MHRRLKQFLYGLLYLAVLFLIGYGVYHAAVPVPSCLDSIQNQGETGVDCGGPCAKVCAPATGIEIIGNAEVFPIGQNYVGLLARVENPDPNYAANYLTYSFSLSDSSGNVIKSVPSASFVYSNEIKYLFLPVVSVSSSLVNGATVVVGDVNWVASSTMGAEPMLNFQGVSTATSSDNSGNLAVSGLIVNNDTVPFPHVIILAVFRDAGGRDLGISQTVVDNLGLNGSRRFTVLHPPLAGVDFNQTQIFAYALRP